MGGESGVGDAERLWLRLYDDDVPAEVDVPDRPFAEVLDEAADRWPGSRAICHLGRELAYRELRHEVDQLSTSLGRLGVAPGDRVGLVLPNTPQFVIALFAVLRLGGVAVPLPATWTAVSLAAALADCGAEVVVCLDRAYERVAAAREDAETAVREIVVTLASDYLPALDRLALNVPTRSVRRALARGAVPPRAGVRMWDEELRRSRGVPASAPGKAEGVAPGEDPAVLVYPVDPADAPDGAARGLVLTSRNLWAAGMQAATWLTHARPGREAVLVGLPLTTGEGLALCLSGSILLGAELLLVPRHAVEAAPAVLSALRPTVAIGPPEFLDELLVDREATDSGIDLRSLRLCVTGPCLLDHADAQRYEALSGAAVVDGLSVPGAPVLLGRPMRTGRAGGSDTARTVGPSRRLGVPLPSTEIRIVDRSGAALPVGHPGRLLARGPQVSSGLWARPQETSGVRHDGWLVTGVDACLHGDGWVEVLSNRTVRHPAD